MSGPEGSVRPFRFERSSDGGNVKRSLMWAARPALERALAFPVLNAIYARIQATEDDRHFADRVLSALDVQCQVDQEQLARVPASGPLVVVANHPFGGIEGVILLSLLRRVRPDVRILANYMLSAIPDLRDSFFFVDPFGREDSTAKNLGAMRSAIDWVRQGHVLGVFPSGAVSHLHLRKRAVMDPAWSPTVARIIRRTDATVTPVFFDGRNSNLFQLAGFIHPSLRTVMLPREMLRRRAGKVRAIVGRPIPAGRLSRLEHAEELISYLRVRTYILKPRKERRTLLFRKRADSASNRVDEPIVDAVDPQLLADDIALLSPRQKLHVNGDLEAYYARSRQIPHVLREIGRMREISFRLVGEGTGKPIDLDRFDKHYLHLFLWDRSKGAIAGAYRLGQTDRIMRRFGKRGLYTTTLFHIKTRLLQQIGPALELGRSFVAPDYQKSYSPLMMLWRAIGAYAAANPRYRMLFGPVSISAMYSSMSKHLLVKFLRLNKSLPQLERLVRPKNPPHLPGAPHVDDAQLSTVVHDLDEVNSLVSELEADGKTMPVLLRQYLKLNARLLGFNLDPEFGDVVDGLVLIDLVQMDDKVRNRYMGKESSATFMAYHGKPAEEG